MSIRYKGGILSATPPTLVAGAGASGAWTLEQQMQATAAGNWPVNGPFYVEDVFSTYLYTGTGSALTITNNIDLSNKGGMVWLKDRSQAYDNGLFDTARGAGDRIISNSTAAANNSLNYISAFNTNGFSLGSPSVSTNNSGDNYVSWTFRKQPKFFDVVTYTGNGGVQNIAHNLGSVPGCIIVKSTSQVSNWAVYHTSLGNTQFLALNQTNAATTLNYWNDTSPTSTQFTVNGYQAVGSAGQTYVAYLFAHDAGGFGLTGTDNVISCGSLTSSGSGGATVTLNYEAQWILLKNTSAAENWIIVDTMRGMSFSSTPFLKPNLSDAEGSLGAGAIVPTATGFTVANGVLSNSNTYIYIAIRRGPMKVPTSGTSVLGVTSRTGTAANATVTGLNAVDFMLTKMTSGLASGPWANRLTGNNYMSPTASDAQTTNATSYQTNPWDVQNGVKVGTGAVGSLTNLSGETYINYLFGRAPSFFDIVCYTGTGVATTITHNLGTAPLLYIVKCRSNSAAWYAYSQTTGATYYINASNDAAAANDINFWNNTAPTSSVFSVNTEVSVNGSARTYIAYLFATCPGVSKVGSYTGTAALQTIDCGFTTGARFVMIKRTNGTGDWYVYDSTRGLSSGNDPYFLWTQPNSEVTNTNYVDTDTTGFKVTAAAPIQLNAVGGTYIFLAIA